MFLKATAVTGFTFGLVKRADGTAVTSGSCVGYLTKDGGLQTALASTPVHEGHGQWSVDLSAAEMDATIVGLLFVHPDAIPVQFTIRTSLSSGWSIEDGEVVAGTTYLTVEEAREYLPEGNLLTDLQVQASLELCQEVINSICGQTFMPVVAARVFDGPGTSILNLVRPALEVTKIEVLEDCSTTWTEIDAQTFAEVRLTESHTMLIYGNPYRTRYPASRWGHGLFSRGVQNIRVTAAWGVYDTPPAAIKHALGLLVRYAGSEDDPHGTPGTAFESESIGGDRSFQNRRLWAGSAKTSGGTGFADVDSILVRYQAAPTVTVI